MHFIFLMHELIQWAKESRQDLLLLKLDLVRLMLELIESLCFKLRS